MIPLPKSTLTASVVITRRQTLFWRYIMNVLPIRIFAKELSNKKEIIPYTAWIRSVYASVYALPDHRPYAVANFLTDLGVRIREDPFIYMREAAEEINVDINEYMCSFPIDTYLNNLNDTLSISQEKAEYFLSADLDILVNYAGQWDLASDISSRFIDKFGIPNDLTLKIYMAGALSGSHDSEKIHMLFNNIETTTSNPVKLSMTYIRHAAYEIKRKNNIPTAHVLLDKNDNQIITNLKKDHLSSADAATLLGVSFNLRALAEIHASNFKNAYNLIMQARDNLSTDSALVVIGQDEKKRYYEQVTINWIQLLIRDRNLELALITAKQNVEWVFENHPDYQGEALYVYGYVCYLSQKHEQAYSSLHRAVIRLSRDGNVTALSSARKMLAVVCYALGRNVLCQSIISSLESDPAGLHIEEILQREA